MRLIPRVEAEAIIRSPMPYSCKSLPVTWLLSLDLFNFQGQRKLFSKICSDIESTPILTAFIFIARYFSHKYFDYSSGISAVFFFCSKNLITPPILTSLKSRVLF